MAAVEVERRDRVGIIRLNRPEARNAVNNDLATGVEAALDDFETDPDVQAVVITGNGKTFCAGADLKLVAAGRGAEMATAKGNFAGIVTRDFPKPIIAAVHGAALAGGFEIMLSCDLVVAADDTRFGLPEVKRGLFAAAGGLIRLPKRVPLAVATELAITGEPIDAPRALQLGLVNRIVPADQVVDAALELAATIAENGPLAIKNSLAMVRDGKALFSEDARASVLVNDFNDAAQFNRAMRSTDEDEWFTDEVWLNPWSNNHAVMVFVKAINPARGCRPDGVLYLEFDWEALMGDVLHAPEWHSPVGDDGLRISIVDTDDHLVGSSWGGKFGAPVAIPPGGSQGIETRANSVAVFATARPIHGFDALGLRCVIEQSMPSEEDIKRAVGATRRAAA